MLATDACRRGWTGVDYVQAGLSELPGEPVGTAGRTEAPAKTKTASTVYEDYFPIGSAPTEPCPIHGAAPAIDGVTGALGSGTAGLTEVPPSPATSTIPATYQPAPRVQRIVGADGHVTWVIRDRN